MTCQLIDIQDKEGAYGFIRTEALIAHPEFGRLYISEGYGGEETSEGGAYRWKHGVCAKVKDTDTLDSLYGQDAGLQWPSSVVSVMCQGYDDERPLLSFRGFVIESLAKQAGID